MPTRVCAGYSVKLKKIYKLRDVTYERLVIPGLPEEARGGHQPRRLVVVVGGGARPRQRPHVLPERRAELLVGGELL